MHTVRWPRTVLPAALALLALCGCKRQGAGTGMPPDAAARAFIERHIAKTRPLEKESNLAWWKANLSGKAEDFEAKEKAENALDKALADPTAFAEVKGIRQREAPGGIQDPLVKRSIDLIYLSYLGKQVEPKLLEQMTAKSNAVERQFNTYRAPVGDRKLSENDVRKILRESASSEEREQAWKASKGVGRDIEPVLKELVKLRNQSAKQLGFRDYYALSLYLNEQDEGALLALFGQLDDLTRKPFEDVKARIDKALAVRFHITPEQLRPWHYEDPFFQEAPHVGGLKFDTLYAKKDILKIARDFYAGVGLPIDDVLARSDLYEKDGKSPHAFSTDIDREGDIRVLANIRPNDYWMNTMLHELGHAAYSSNIDRKLPYTLRVESHILTTEGIAMMFGRANKRPEWLQAALGIHRRQAARYGADARRTLRMETLIFSRWCQVMLHFARHVRHSRSGSFKTLVEPGRKIPGLAPAGEALRAGLRVQDTPRHGSRLLPQLHDGRAVRLAGAPRHGPRDGRERRRRVRLRRPQRSRRVLKQKVFGPGDRYSWNELTKLATGAPLGAADYAQEFVRE